MFALPERHIASARATRHSKRTVEPMHSLPHPSLRREGLTERCKCSCYAFPKEASEPFALCGLELPNGYTTVLAHTRQGQLEPESLEQKDCSDSLRRVSVQIRRAGIGFQRLSNTPTGAARLASSISQQLHRASGSRGNDQGQYERPGSSKPFADRTCRPESHPEFICKGMGESRC